MIKAYFICSLEGLDYVENEVKELCEFFGARAYINLAPKSIKKTTMLQLTYLTQRVYEGNFKKIWKSWDTCAGEIKGEKPRWVVDVDDNNFDFESLDMELCALDPVKLEDGVYLSKIITKIPTKNGYHLITTPFNLQQFKEKYPDIDVHKNNPTLLYCL